MEKFKRSFRLFLIPLLTVSMAVLSFPALPSAAAERYVPVTITPEMYQGMLTSGDLTAQIFLSRSNSSDSFILFDLSSAQSVTLNQDANFNLGGSTSISTQFDSNYFYIYSTSAVMLNQMSGYLNYTYSIILPFDLYIGTEVSSFRTLFPFPSPENVGTAQLTIQLYDGSNVVAQSSINTTASPTYWRSNSFTAAVHSSHSYLPSGWTYDTSSTGVRFGLIQRNSQLSVSSGYVHFDNISISVNQSGTDSDASTDYFLSPLGFGLGFAEFFVRQSDEEAILEYLDIISSPTPTAAQAQRLNQLRQSFNNVQADLYESAEVLNVEIPDDLPSVDSLPEEVIEGLSQVSEYVVSPILNNPTIIILVSSVFVFTIIKLLLFGSGPS